MNDPELAADTIAYARELRALYRAAEQRAVRFRLLVEMSRDLVSVRDTDALLELALTRATMFSGYSDGCVLLRDGGGQLMPRAVVGVGATVGKLASRDPGWADAGRALTQRQALVLSGPASLTGWGMGQESRIYLPLIPSDGQPLGVLLLSGVEAARPPDADDLDALQLLAGQLAAALQSTQLHEEKGRLVARLVEREHRLAELVDKLIYAQEEERRRIAYELHDGLAQMTLGVLQQLHMLIDRYKPRAPQSRQALTRAVDMAAATVGEARRVIAGLRPPVLDDFGLATGLRLLAAGLQAEGWEVAYETTFEETRLPPAVETAIYRIAQELLTNVRKHAGPTRIQMSLRRADEGVTLTIQDWGRGFTPGAQPGPSSAGEHIGLASIEERVTLLGGTWRLESSPGSGTLAEVVVPHPIPLAGEPHYG